MKIAVFGQVQEKVHPEIQEMASSLSFWPYNEASLIDLLPVIPTVALCYLPEEGSEFGPLEIAQALRANYPEASIFFIATDKKDFDKKKMVKNGFTNAFLLPWEKAELIKAMRDEALYTKIPQLRGHTPVKVVDIVPGIVLDFDLMLYMPLNGKFLPFSIEGQPVMPEKYQKMIDGKVNTLFVRNEDLASFYRYTAKLFTDLIKTGSMSETEKNEKLTKSVRELISDLFIQDSRENTFTKATALLNDVKAIVEVMMDESNHQLMEKIQNLVNQENGFYLHTSNVATYAGLFGMVLNYAKPADLALAGIVHDLGKINLPEEIAELDESQMSPEFLVAYQQHPIHTMDILKLKRMVVSEATRKAILHHHEALNGSGYPEKLDGRRISEEGRILAIADTFDYLTSIKPGQKNMSPAEALNFMLDENSKDPGRMILDVVMIRDLMEVFLGKENGSE
jgi:HD-GYP domain-containing protein (c-di-GMP phosphodiesterase class II)